MRDTMGAWSWITGVCTLATSWTTNSTANKRCCWCLAALYTWVNSNKDRPKLWACSCIQMETYTTAKCLSSRNRALERSLSI
jgi:hypothetical protein